MKPRTHLAKEEINSQDDQGRVNRGRHSSNPVADAENGISGDRLVRGTGLTEPTATQLQNAEFQSHDRR